MPANAALRSHGSKAARSSHAGNDGIPFRLAPRLDLGRFDDPPPGRQKARRVKNAFGEGARIRRGDG
jgi:hypothetical protein